MRQPAALSAVVLAGENLPAQTVDVPPPYFFHGHVVVTRDGRVLAFFRSRDISVESSGRFVIKVDGRIVLRTKESLSLMAVTPDGERTALIIAQGKASDTEAPRAGILSGVLRRVFTDGRWSAPEFIRSLRISEYSYPAVPAVARLIGEAGPVEVEVMTQNLDVAIVGATYDANEQLVGETLGTVTFTYRGTLPRSPGGYVAVYGWSGTGSESG